MIGRKEYFACRCTSSTENIRISYFSLGGDGSAQVSPRPISSLYATIENRWEN